MITVGAGSKPVRNNNDIVGANLCVRPDLIQIQVSDNGKGIPPEILPKLMQRGSTHGKRGGSGLGLYHAKTTLQSWDGDLKIESKSGTTVSLILPNHKNVKIY